MSDGADRLVRRAIFWGGIWCALAYAAAMFLSWLLAPLATFEERPYGQYEFFARIADAIPWIQGRAYDGLSAWRFGVQLALRGRGLFASPESFIAGYALPLLLASLGTLGVAAVAVRHRASLGEHHVRQAWRWTVAYAVACVLAAPVLVPDFWLSVAWGRTLAAGINPYYEVPAAATSWLPLDAPIMKMTYGPMWAYVSAALMKLTGGHALWGALGFKIVLAALWVALICLVRIMVRDLPFLAQIVAVLLVGWLPIGVLQTVADGHNDVAMVVCALLWLHLRRTGRPMAATIALTASVLFKYASAPLFLVDLLYREPDESREARAVVQRYLPRAIVAAALSVVTFLPVYRGTDFFVSTAEVHGGRFFLPSDAVLAIGSILHLPLVPLAYVAAGVFPVIAIVALYRLVRDGGPARLTEASTAIMLAMLLVGSSHAWPWYVLWFVAFAAVVPLSGYGRWAAGLALAMPYPLLVWTVWPHASDFKKFLLPSLLAYGLALAWFLMTRRALSAGRR
ncbi:MAG: hypothetical protein MNPFHGCM_02089 [Gemmatimonadaceae bacterium]|nr:hypothetical protein [Gemmatimonadaceae bacterium]